MQKANETNALDSAYITRTVTSINYAKGTYGAPRIVMATAALKF